MRLIILSNLIFFVVVKRFSLILLIEKLFSKKGHIFLILPREIKLGKLEDEITSDLFTVICVTVPLSSNNYHNKAQILYKLVKN